MRTALVIASVLLAGVALEVAAYRIDSNYENQSQNGDQRFDYRQTDSYAADGFGHPQQQVFADDHVGSGQYGKDHDYYGPGHAYGAQNLGASVGHRSAGLVGAMIEKIAAFRKIALRGPHFERAAAADKDAIKLSDRDFVTFYNATLTRLDDGRLEYAYVNAERDVAAAQYRFDRVRAVGSFKSNVAGAKTGAFDVVMNDVTGNVSTGFDAAAAAADHAAGAYARFRWAEATVTTADGAETRAFDEALERRYLAVLQKAVAARVAAEPAIALMRREAREPMAVAGPGELFDMTWTEDGATVLTPGVGFRPAVASPARVAAASFYRGRKTRVMFALTGLGWTSPLTVEHAGRRTTARSADVSAGEVYVHVTVHEAGGHRQQPCGQVNVHVEAPGLRYGFGGENVPSEFATVVQDKLQRFFEHSLEYYVQQPLEQGLCDINKY